MPGSLEKFSDEDMRPQDTRGRFGVLVRLMQFVNACLNPQILTNTGRNFLSFSESNLTLELNLPLISSSTATALNPWQPYLSPTATGDAAGRTIRLVPSVVWDGTRLVTPARPNLEITVPADCTDGFFVWLVATVATNGTVSSLDYGYGTALPSAVGLTQDATGTPPPTAYDLLFCVTSDDTSVDLANAYISRDTPLSLVPQLTGNTATSVERRMVFLPPRSPSDIPGYESADDVTD